MLKRNTFTAANRSKWENIFLAIASVVVFGFMLAYILQNRNLPFIFDSKYYWDFRNDFDAGGQFSFTGFTSDVRGYFLPFLFYLIKLQAGFMILDDRLLFGIWSALFFTLLSLHLIPWSLRVLFQQKTSLPGRLLFSTLMFIFWRGYFIYPISDFIAFTALLVSLTLLIASIRQKTHLPYAFCIGLFIGMAINIRPIYLVSLIVIFGIAIIGWMRGGIKKVLLWGFLSLIGLALVLYPQYLINRTNFQSNSPLVLSRHDDTNLYLMQLFKGLEFQKKLEWELGGKYLGPGYPDPVFKKITTNMDMKKWTSQWSIRGYLKILKQYPTDMAVSYFRHTFNALDIFYPTPYIYDQVFLSHTLFSLANYILWFLFFHRILQFDFSRVDLLSLGGLVCLLVPLTLTIPTVIEVRFFLPLYVLAYGTISYDINYKAWFASIMDNKRRLARFLILGIAWVLACFALSSSVVEQIRVLVK